LLPTPSAGAGTRGSSSRLTGAQLYDLLCVLLLLGAVTVLSQIKPGVIYYWMKDITSEFLKIQVLFNALEILDKVIVKLSMARQQQCSGEVLQHDCS
jgi:hypothetical protein